LACTRADRPPDFKSPTAARPPPNTTTTARSTATAFKFSRQTRFRDLGEDDGVEEEEEDAWLTVGNSWPDRRAILGAKSRDRDGVPVLSERF
jgi:hypothetical protein